MRARALAFLSFGLCVALPHCRASSTGGVPLPRYLEASKTRLSGPRATAREAAQARRVLVYVFDTCLRLLHPYMPFVTETLWQQLPTDPNHGKGVNHTHTRTRMPYLRRLVGASLHFLSLSLCGRSYPYLPTGRRFCFALSLCFY